MADNATYNNLTPGKENYLKALLRLWNGDEMHSSDVAAVLGVTKASVSSMMNRLREEGYVQKKRYGAVTLTEKGLHEAAAVQRRYQLLMSYFIQVLGVDEETASEDACRIEHIISDLSIEKIDEQLNCL